MATATDLVEAVYAVYDSATITGSPAVSMSYVPIFTDEGMKAGDASVTIFLASRTWTIENRCWTSTKTYTVNIALREYVDRSDGTIPNSGVTLLLDLSEELVDIALDNGSLAGCTLIGVTESQPFDFQRMFDAGIFENLISLEYKAK